MKALAALPLLAAPALAAACASCARETAPGAWLLIAALIAAPYGVALGVVAWIRRQVRDGGAP